MVRDPICHMEIDATQTSIQTTYRARVFFFCSAGCKSLFEQTPAHYAEETFILPDETFDMIIIGGGPAGLTAAVYASIQHMHTLLITETVGGQAIESSNIKNYMGFEFITGNELVDKFRDQLIQAHFVRHKLGRVEAVHPHHEAYTVQTTDGRRFQSKTLLIATGMRRRQLHVPGEERLRGRGVGYSVVQEMARFHGLKVAVIGGGNSALQTAIEFSQVAQHVYLIAREELTGDRDDIQQVHRLTNVTLLTHAAVQEICGAAQVESLVVQVAGSDKTQDIAVAGVFITIGFTPNASLVASLVKCNERGEIVIGPDCSTSAPGVFAAGDVTNAYGKRVIVATGEGAKAALAAYHYLLHQQAAHSVG